MMGMAMKGGLRGMRHESVASDEPSRQGVERGKHDRGSDASKLPAAVVAQPVTRVHSILAFQVTAVTHTGHSTCH